MTSAKRSLVSTFASRPGRVAPSDLPLMDVFTCLRERYGMSLGVEDYLLALQALRLGIGWEDRDALHRLCCILWAKSTDEAARVVRVMDELLGPLSRPAASSTTKTPTRTQAEPAARRKPRRRAPTVDTDPVRRGVEPVQVAQGIRRATIENLELRPPRPRVVTDYLPVTRRQMKQSWRHLRRKVREGPPEDLDIEATVSKILREGVLLDPVLRRRRINRAVLVMLVDQGGSMVPFHSLTRQLWETAQRDGRLGTAGAYYFHDYPGGFLYADPGRVEGESTESVLGKLDTRAAVVIVSDAGAARGKFDTERINRTRTFLEQLRRSVRHYAWLNPMPRTRWTNTTAGEIARLAPMFEMSRQGLDDTINMLLGHVV